MGVGGGVATTVGHGKRGGFSKGSRGILPCFFGGRGRGGRNGREGEGTEWNGGLTVDRVEGHAAAAVVGVVPVVAIVLEAAVAVQLESAGVEADAGVALRARPGDGALDVRLLLVREVGRVGGVDDQDVLARAGGAQLVAHVLRELRFGVVVAVVDAFDEAEDERADRLADVDAGVDEGDDEGHGGGSGFCGFVGLVEGWEGEKGRCLGFGRKS